MPKRSEEISYENTAYEQELARAIGARIRARRLDLNLTQAQVRTRMASEKVYTSRSHYSRTEAGENLLRASEIIALTRALDVSADWLLFGAND